MDEKEKEEINFQFELLNSEDGRTITLVCSSDIPLDPDEYAEALRCFLERLDTLSSLVGEGELVN